MYTIPFTASVEGACLKLCGTLDDSEEVRDCLVNIFQGLKEEEEKNRAVGTPDDPEFEEWEKSNAAQNPIAGKVHINRLTGPAYKSIVVDAQEMLLGTGGLNLWIELVHAYLCTVALRYENSVFGEILQYMAQYYRHPRTIFLCQTECLLEQERRRKKASTLVDNYHVVLKKMDGGKWTGAILELPGSHLVALYVSVEKCVEAVTDFAIFTVEEHLARGYMPPLPMDDWRKRFKGGE